MTSLAEMYSSMNGLLDWLRGTRPLGAAAEERAFPVYDGGFLRLSVPPRWNEEFHIAGERCSLVFRAAARAAVALRIETSALSVQESLSYSVEDMRKEVEVAARAASASSIEVFAGRHGGGFHFSSMEAGSGWRLLQGRFLARPVLLDFRMAWTGRSGWLARAALELVRTARASAD